MRSCSAAAVASAAFRSFALFASAASAMRVAASFSSRAASAVFRSASARRALLLLGARRVRGGLLRRRLLRRRVRRRLFRRCLLRRRRRGRGLFPGAGLLLPLRGHDRPLLLRRRLGPLAVGLGLPGLGLLRLRLGLLRARLGLLRLQAVLLGPGLEFKPTVLLHGAEEIGPAPEGGQRHEGQYGSCRSRNSHVFSFTLSITNIHKRFPRRRAGDVAPYQRRTIHRCTTDTGRRT